MLKSRKTAHCYFAQGYSCLYAHKVSAVCTRVTLGPLTVVNKSGSWRIHCCLFCYFFHATYLFSHIARSETHGLMLETVWRKCREMMWTAPRRVAGIGDGTSSATGNKNVNITPDWLRNRCNTLTFISCRHVGSTTNLENTYIYIYSWSMRCTLLVSESLTHVHR